MNLKLDRILNYSIYLLVFLAPVFWVPFFFEAWEFPKQFLLLFLSLLIFTLSLVKAFLQRSFKILWPFDVLVLGFLLIAALASIFSVDRIFSLFGFYGRFSDSLINLISLGLIYFSVSRSSKEPDARFLKALLLSGLLVTVFSCYFLLIGRSNFNLAAPSLEGLAMFLAPLLFLSLNLDFKKISLVFSLLALGLIFLIDYTPSLIALGLTAVFYLVFLLINHSQGLKGENKVIALMLICFSAVAITGFAFDLPKSFLSFPREVTLNYETSWQVVVDSLKSRPILGSGPGTFFHDFSKFRLADFNLDPLWQVRFDRPLGYFAEIASTLGILGLLAYLILALTALNKALKLKTEILIFPLLAMLIGQACYYQNTVSAFIFWFWLAMIAGLSSREKKVSFVFDQETLKGRITALAGIIFLSLISLTVIFSVLRIYSADYFYSQSFRKPAGEEKTALLKKAILTNPYFSQYQITLSQALLNNAVLESQKPAKDSQKIFQLVIEATDSANKATRLSPNWVMAWQTLGAIYQEVLGLVVGAEDWGIKSFEKAIDLEPTNPLFYSESGKIYFAKDEFDKAKEQFVKAQILKPGFLESQFFLSLIKEKQGDAKGAVKSLERLQNFYPLNSDIVFQLGRLYFNRGETDKAIAQFQNVLEINPDHLDSLYLMALALEKKGERTEALIYIAKALALSPENQVLKKKFEDLKD